MRRVLDSWFSPNLNREMEIAIYGHYGVGLLMFPSAGADYLEYERFYMIASIKHLIEAGKVKAFSINSINQESWLNPHLSGKQKAQRHQLYNRYVEQEVVPYIRRSLGGGQSTLLTSGVSLGAYHGCNVVLRRPDLFDGTIGLSGIYDLKQYSAGYSDQIVYSHSPIDYLPNLPEHHVNMLRHNKHLYFLTGQGAYEAPHESKRISNALNKRGVPNKVEVWGREYMHDWPTWRDMLPNFLGRLLGA